MRGLVACVLVLGCYHEPAGAPPQPPPHNAAPPYATALADPLGFLPIDSELVLAVDLRMARTSATWQHYAPLIAAAAAKPTAEMQQACGFDPVADMTRIALGMKHLGAEHPEGVLVITGIERAKLEACLRKQVAEHHDVTREGETYSLRGKAGGDIALRIVGERTLVAAIAPGTNAHALQAILDGGVPLRTSPMFVQLFERIDAHQAMWFALNGNSAAFDRLAALGIRAHAVFGWLGLRDGVALTVHMVLASAGDAQQAVATFQPQAGMAKALVDSLELVADEADLVLTVALSDTKLDALIQMVGAAMP